MKKTLLWIVLGSLIFVIGFLSGSFWSTWKFFSSRPVIGLRTGAGGSYAGPQDVDSDFYGSIFWGAMFKRIEELEPLPEGDAELKVQFTYDDKPAVGVGFSLALNGRYATAMMTTDVNGEAAIPLAFGQWQLNRLVCRRWQAKPEGDFLLVSGDEAKLGSTSFSELFFAFDGEGKTVDLSKGKKSSQTIKVRIRDRMKFVWPLLNQQKQNATIANSTIEWEPYPQAVSYVVQISRVTHESARSTTFSPIIYKQVNGENSLALAQLPNAEGSTPGKEYAAEIRAYDPNGSFLSETEHGFSTFILTDNHELVEFDQRQGVLFDQGDVDRSFQAQKTTEAAILLIEKKMFREAGALLDQADVSALPGRFALVSGYLHAAQGKCEEAEKQFKEATALGETCIPKTYRAGCMTE